jgi:hypothetical protein
MLKTLILGSTLLVGIAADSPGLKQSPEPCVGALSHWQDWNPAWKTSCSYEAFCSTKKQDDAEEEAKTACIEAEKATMKTLNSVEDLTAVLEAAGSASTPNAKPDTELPWRVSVPDFKATDTAMLKTFRKKAPIPVAELYDINRAMVVFKNPTDLLNYMKVLKKTIKTHGYKVVLFKNRFCKVDSSGYRDMKIGLKKIGKLGAKPIDWGEVSEVQFLIEPFATIKSHHEGMAKADLKKNGISDKENEERTEYLTDALDYVKKETTIPTLTAALHNGHIMYERSRVIKANNSVEHLMPVFLQRLMNDFVDDNEFDISDRKDDMEQLCASADNALAFSTQTFVDYGRHHKKSTYYKLMSFNLEDGKSQNVCEEAPMFSDSSAMTKIQEKIEAAETEAKDCVDTSSDAWECLKKFDETLNIHFVESEKAHVHPKKADKKFLKSFAEFVKNDSGFCKKPSKSSKSSKGHLRSNKKA